MNKPLVWSYSAMSAFQKCPRQYHEVRVLKKYKFDSPAAAEGTRQHEAFEYAVKSKKPLPPNMQHYQPMIDKLNALRGDKYAEIKMALNVQGQPCDYFAGDIWVRAVADLLVMRGNEALLWDYKGGKSRYADTSQLKLTSLILFQKHPKLEVVKSALLFTAENKAIPAVFARDKKEEYWQPFLKDYKQMVMAHKSGNFMAKPSGLCTVCAVLDCPNNKNPKI